MGSRSWRWVWVDVWYNCIGGLSRGFVGIGKCGGRIGIVALMVLFECSPEFKGVSVCFHGGKIGSKLRFDVLFGRCDVVACWCIGSSRFVVMHTVGICSWRSFNSSVFACHLGL